MTPETRPYEAVVLGAGWGDPPLRLFPGLDWPHLTVFSAIAFVFGVVIYNTAVS